MNRRGLLGLGAAAVALPGMAFTERLRDRRLFDVQAYGARGDGKAKNTDAIQKAINAAYQAGGGVVYLSPGIYLSGGIVLKDNVTLDLEMEKPRIPMPFRRQSMRLIKPGAESSTSARASISPGALCLRIT